MILVTSRPVLLGRPTKKCTTALTIYDTIDVLSETFDQMNHVNLEDTREEFRIHADAEGTDEDLPVQQSDQDPHHGGQQRPLDHG